MSAAPQPASSDSMEDILQSIKRIIENDGVDPPPAPSDVLELTQVVGEDNSVITLPPPPAAPIGDVIESIDTLLGVEKAHPPAALPPMAPEPPVAPVPKEKLLSGSAEQATLDALKALKTLPHREHGALPPLRSGATVEDLLLEALRPMLKSWLEEHLPGIVRHIVEQEVQRLIATGA